MINCTKKNTIEFSFLEKKKRFFFFTKKDPWLSLTWHRKQILTKKINLKFKVNIFFRKGLICQFKKIIYFSYFSLLYFSLIPNNPSNLSYFSPISLFSHSLTYFSLHNFSCKPNAPLGSLFPCKTFPCDHIQECDCFAWWFRFGKIHQNWCFKFQTILYY